MRIIFRIITTALIFSAALVSCQKGLTETGKSDGTTGGERIITISFATTKTGLDTDGLTPVFEEGDKIMISNGEAKQECTVRANGTERTVNTALIGALTAVYPSSAARLNGNDISGFDIPAVQTGEFKDANICMATIGESENSASFSNRTALFRITPPAGTKRLTVKSLKQVEDGVARTGTAAEINTVGTGDGALSITVGSLDDEPLEERPYYISVSPGVKLTDLSFDAASTVLEGRLKGIPVKDVKSKAGGAAEGSAEFEARNVTRLGTLYTINNDNGWHPYVHFGNLKWAKANIGAETELDAGLYFSWADTTGHAANNDHTIFADLWKFEDVRSKYYTNSTSPAGYRKYNATDGKKVLDLIDDAAYYNWGGPWRMPTGGYYEGEMNDLIENATIASTSEGSSPNKIYRYILKWKADNNAQLCFFCAGSGDVHGELQFYNTYNNSLRYWSSTVENGTNPIQSFYFGNGSSGSGLFNSTSFRYTGFPIRPVADL